MNAAGLPPSLTSAIFLGLIQGLTEFLPVSSSGHLAAAQLLFPCLAYPGVTLEVATHVGTTFAVLFYYRHLLAALISPSVAASDQLLGLDRTRWYLLLIVGTLPTVLIGFAARDVIRAAFDELIWIAGGLAITGCVLFVSRWSRAPVGDLVLPVALVIGTVQGLAIFPGVSRAGLTITAAMLMGVKHRQAVTYSLLLSIPAVLGAALLDAVQTFAGPAPATLLFTNLLFATLAAGIVGYICIGLVHRATRAGWWYRFAWYCWLASLVLFVAALRGR